jgi:hypothetical protein
VLRFLLALPLLFLPNALHFSGAPLVADRDGREVQLATGIMFLLFVIGATLQVRRLRKQTKAPVVESFVEGASSPG